MSSVAGQIVDWTLARPATLGAGRLICIDGPAGSGKTTLGLDVQRVVRDRLRLPGRAHAQLLHMDDLYEGWSGLDGALPRVAHDIVGPLRSGQPGGYRRYDWVRGQLAESRVVDVVDVLIIEGVGSGAAAYDDAITCLVWVEAPTELRLVRGLERDGEQMRERWLAWRIQEDEMFVRERTLDRSQVVVDGTGESPLRFV